MQGCLRRLSVLLVAVLTLLTLGPSSEASAQSAADQVAGEFVGTVVGQPHLFVAVVADPVAEGASERRVRGYLCDGEQVAEWFVGSVAANAVDLTNEGGLRLVAQLSEGAANGRMILPSGVVLNYEAPRASGLAGLYDVEVTPEGQIRGMSVGGVRYEGQFSRDPASGQLTAARRFVLPSGEIRELNTPLNGQPLGRYHVIVQGDMSLRGADTEMRSSSSVKSAGQPIARTVFYFACFTLTSISRGDGLDPHRCS